MTKQIQDILSQADISQISLLVSLPKLFHIIKHTAFFSCKYLHWVDLQHWKGYSQAFGEQRLQIANPTLREKVIVDARKEKYEIGNFNYSTTKIVTCKEGIISFYKRRQIGFEIRHYPEISPSFCEDFRSEFRFPIGESPYT
ncbi:hypothetical protein M5K25_018844 [Dendrobium thyrsiflorum]|uniref:Uncharacterized protein n=1 Tax=Dendrobium thyrsiflorum TaxID=117978 RepID=A0ABD0UD89_DENTH